MAMSLGSHHKPYSVINVSNQISSTTSSPNVVHRSMATVSPLYQVSGTVPHSVPHSHSHSQHTQHSTHSHPCPPPSHGGPQLCHSSLSNSALAATRTSSFAAALRNLANQSNDPLIVSDSGGQQCSSLDLSISHATNTSKTAANVSSFQTAYQSSSGCGPQSPPIVTIAPIAANQMDSTKSETHSYYDHQSKESVLYSHPHSRTSPIVQVRPRGRNVAYFMLNCGQSSNGSHTQSNPSNKSGFQPYRTGYEDALRSNSTSALTGTSLPSHLLPNDSLTFPYHPFMPPMPPSIASSTSISHHVPHPSASYRLDAHFYMDRYGLLRGSLNSGSAMSHANSIPASNVPLNLARYSELLSSQQERLLNEDRLRLLNQTLPHSSYKSPVQMAERQPIHLIHSSNERSVESNSDQYLINHTNGVTSSKVPLNLARYSEMITSQERLYNDERQRILSQSLSQSSYKSPVQTAESPSPLHLMHSNDRYVEYKSDQYLKNEANSVTASNVPLNLVRNYPELLASQQERLFADERQRILSQPMHQNVYKSPVQSAESPPIHYVHSSNDRHIESSSDQYLINHSNSINSSSVPFNLARYSELLNSQHERYFSDERQRILNHALSKSAYESIQTPDSPPLQLILPSADRHSEPNNEQYLINHVNYNALNTPLKCDYSNSSGSILSGTPRDIIPPQPLNLSHSMRKLNRTPISASVKPLNISSNSENNNREQTYLWRPQSDEERERSTTYGPVHIQIPNESAIEANQRTQNLISDNLLDTKGLLVNNVENITPVYSNRTHEKVNSTTKFVSDKSEGLPSRILENSERSGVNGSLFMNQWQSNIGPESQLSNNSMCSPTRNEIEECVVSKLDADELKLKQKRLNKNSDVYSSSEEDDDNEECDYTDEETKNKLKYMIVLTKGLPLKLDTDPEKINFLKMFNLTTHKRKSQIEFNKYLKRRKLLRETSPIPFNEISDLSGMSEENKENPDVLIGSNILPDSLKSQERNLDVKLHFMSTIGLREHTSIEKQRDNELLWEGILREREMRIKKSKCWTKLVNNLNKETLHKWLMNLQTNLSYSTCDSDINSRFNVNGFIHNGLTMPKYGNHHHSSQQRGQRKVIMYNKHHDSNAKTSKSIFRENRANSQHLSKEFAQEFHDSVLFQTTKQQIVRQEHQTRPNEQHRYYADLSSSSSFKWSGIEAVMEAYERYNYEQKQEKDFLQVRAHQLKNKLQDLNREAEYLSQKMADLVQEKTSLDDQREQYQSALDALKNYLKQLR